MSEDAPDTPGKTSNQRGRHPNSQAALVPFRFQRGRSGNPSGRPERKKLATRLRDLMNEPSTQFPGRTIGDVYLAKLIGASVGEFDGKLHPELIELIFNRHDGLQRSDPPPPVMNVSEWTEEEIDEAIQTGRPPKNRR